MMLSNPKKSFAFEMEFLLESAISDAVEWPGLTNKGICIE